MLGRCRYKTRCGCKRAFRPLKATVTGNRSLSKGVCFLLRSQSPFARSFVRLGERRTSSSRLAFKSMMTS